MTIKQIQELMYSNAELTNEMMKNLGQALELKKQIIRNERKINDELFSKIPAKYKFSQMEKIVYYFNRQKGVTLTEISECLGYNKDYIKQISAAISKKIKK